MIEEDSEQKTKPISETPKSENQTADDSSLDNLIRQEQSVARQNLIDGLGREPTQTEIDRWLSEHTEGY